MVLTLNSHAPPPPKKYGSYRKVNQINKGTALFKILHQNIRVLGKKARELLSHFHLDFPMFYA